MVLLQFVLVVGVVAFIANGKTTPAVITNASNPSTTVIPCPDECGLEVERGGRGGKTPFIRWYFDGESCKKFRYTGRNGNANKFILRKDCQERCEDIAACGAKHPPADLTQKDQSTDENDN